MSVIPWSETELGAMLSALAGPEGRRDAQRERAAELLARVSRANMRAYVLTYCRHKVAVGMAVGGPSCSSCGEPHDEGTILRASPRLGLNPTDRARALSHVRLLASNCIANDGTDTTDDDTQRALAELLGLALDVTLDLWKDERDRREAREAEASKIAKAEQAARDHARLESQARGECGRYIALGTGGNCRKIAGHKGRCSWRKS